MQMNIRMYDIIVVGGGLYGAVVARRAKERGLTCLVIERRGEAGGNIMDRDVDGINVHLYGAHIFHTDNEQVWQFVNKFATFDNYVHTVLARNHGRIYHLPVNLQTFYEVYGITRPKDIGQVMSQERTKEHYDLPGNLEEKGVNLIGRTLYDILIRHYTEKQWGCSATMLKPQIIERLPVRTDFDNRYFSDRHQGIPREGYRHLIKGLLDGVEVITGVDFLNEREYWLRRGRRIVYTGMIDELMDYCSGALDYRSLEFRTERMDVTDYQGTAVINETGNDVAYTRTIEHKHFCHNNTTPHTIITREYPQKWEIGKEAYYPVNNERSNTLYKEYRNMADAKYPNMIFGGRLGMFRYFDMDDTIEEAMKLGLGDNEAT